MPSNSPAQLRTTSYTPESIKAWTSGANLNSIFMLSWKIIFYSLACPLKKNNRVYPYLYEFWLNLGILNLGVTVADSWRTSINE
jgi:hypothetical protein